MDELGRAMLRAARCGDIEVIRVLVQHDPDLVHAVNDKHVAPLLEAACWGHMGAMTFLLDTGADVNHCDQFGHTA
eukprot:33186-Eustigmatos_ZCMA.PRE.1